MTDLNEWRLEHPGTALTFGTLAAGYPFIRQVEIGSVETLFTDAVHPSADGMLMGGERRQGRRLTFEIAVSKVVGAGDRWHDTLNAQDTLAAAWDADSIRRTPGTVASLFSVGRGRVVFGRPRNFKPRLDIARRGWSEALCDFQTAHPEFWGATLKSASPAGGGLVAENAGSKATWPRWVINGPATNPWLSWGLTWRIDTEVTIPAGQSLVVETAPWARSVTLNGAPANGTLRGTRINDCMMPAGVQAYGYGGTDAMTLYWRDGFAGL